MLYMGMLGAVLLLIGIVLIKAARTTTEADQNAKEPLVWER